MSKIRRQASIWKKDGESLSLVGDNKGRPDSYAAIRGSTRLSSDLKFTSRVGRCWTANRDGGKIESECEIKKRAEG